MRTTVISALMLLAFTGCIKSADNTNLTVADHDAPTIRNCFSTLIAGPRDKDGKLEKVSFAHGLCQGSSKALDKLSDHTQVMIVKGGTPYTSPLHIQGQDVTANLDGLTVKVATVSADADNAELTLVGGARLELVVETADGAQIWSPTSTAQGRELIRILLN